MSGGVSLVLNLTLTLLQVPLLLTFWGAERYGAWLTLQAVIGLLSTLDLGHHDYIGALLNRHMAERPERIRSCLASAVRVCLFSGGVQLALALLLALYPHAGGVFGLNTAAVDDSEWQAAIVILAVNWALFGSAGGLLVRLYVPHGRFARAVVWSMATRVAQFIALVVAAWGFDSFLIAAVGQVLVSSTITLAALLELRRIFPESWPRWRDGSLAEGGRNLYRAQGLTLAALLEQLSTHGLVLVVGRGLGPEVLPLFTTARTVANVMAQGAGALLHPILPDLSRQHFRREAQKLRETLQGIGMASGTVVNLGALACFALTPTFYTLWTRGRLELDLLLLATIILAATLRCAAIGPHFYLSGTNQVKALIAMALVRAGFSLGGALVLLPSLGLVGVGVALCVAELGAAWIVAPAWGAKLLRTQGGRFPFAIYAQTLVASAGVGVALASAVYQPDWGPVILTAGGFVCIGIAWRQFRQLPATVQNRLLSLTRLARGGAK